jgi:hypothetical protein
LTEIDNCLLLFCTDTKELKMKQTFEELLNRYSLMVDRNIEKRYKKAKDKEFVRKEIEREFAFLNVIQVAGEHKEKMVDTFVTYYKRGENIEEVLLFIRKVYGEDVKDELDFRKIENGVSLPIYISNEEKELREFVMNAKKLKHFFIRFLAFIEIEKNLRVLFIKSDILPALTKEIQVENEKAAQASINNSALIKWTGSRENRNEFVQLIYGLHSSGFINNGKGEITKIVESLASIFDIDLSKNWQSNHSSSIHKSKNDYEPKIFNSIKDAYKDYTTTLVEGKRKR